MSNNNELKSALVSIAESCNNIASRYAEYLPKFEQIEKNYIGEERESRMSALNEEFGRYATTSANQIDDKLTVVARVMEQNKAEVDLESSGLTNACSILKGLNDKGDSLESLNAVDSIVKKFLAQDTALDIMCATVPKFAHIIKKYKVNIEQIKELKSAIDVFKQKPLATLKTVNDVREYVSGLAKIFNIDVPQSTSEMYDLRTALMRTRLGL